MTAPCLSCLLHDLEQPPALVTRKRAALDHTHDVSLTGLVPLVVRMKGPGVSNDLSVHRMRPDEIDLDRDRLVCLARDNDSATNLSFATGKRLLLGHCGSAGCRSTCAVPLAPLAPPGATHNSLAGPPLRALLRSFGRRALRPRLAGKA